ncbi:MAG: phosphatase PAP2 family protein [Waddliaceae bacterium]
MMTMLYFLQKNKRWLLPLLAFGLIAPFTPFLDLTIAHYFYDQGGGRWEPLLSHPALSFCFQYGPIPGQIIAIAALLAFFSSYLFPHCKSWRPHALVLVLTLVVGAGVISYAVFKSHWGRPRPRQVIQFGGQQEFRPFYQPNFFQQPEPSKSFPSGHCTMGFYFFAVVFLGMRLRNKAIFYLGLLFTIFLGLALSFTRMAQGGHFFSDVITSALIMWLTALIIDQVIYERLKGKI